ncbi:formylglycine-generating enzyme required for sulfatase activity [Herbinix hemicellulosilytica]|uniref:Putative secreted protein n=1 Tax=Herbinix hemicellulosilytica TaxID=1564487 RepID=A0A0H5SDL1_HERHM|nr:SUMF1/EgtB/PvdO family nonheme iron enzyme [Herbinix hemicellulosilytica]RBP56884.1 formylglycine-generating enzyme required for sulfatase activity [Herbinix hemicellulosilytica]CRZ33494.1 putative secreted protein [Herbinix hemicellulosilytica]
MKKVLLLILISILILGGCTRKTSKKASTDENITNEMVFVEGGTFVNKNSTFYGKDIVINDFYISKYEITQYEWKMIMGDNPSEFKGDNYPVENVSWYDAIEYCNKRSIKEGLEPYYNIDKTSKDPFNISEYDDIKWTVTINENANGYRLPTEAEWEYAASGGQKSKNYIYSGSDNADKAAWYWRNSGDEYLKGDWSWPKIASNNNRTKPVGSTKPNELGLYDMSGNVREWCWDWYTESDSAKGSAYKIWKGGGWMGDVVCCELSYRGKYEANGMGPDTGFRVCRNP